MSGSSKQLKSYSRPLIAIGILLALMVGALIIQQVQKSSADADAKADTITVEKSASNVVKSSLNLYFAINRSYPFTIDSLRTFLMDPKASGAEANSLQSLDKSIGELKDFKYTVRGDSKAYEFTYTDSDGKSVVVKGEYENDYH